MYLPTKGQRILLIDGLRPGSGLRGLMAEGSSPARGQA
jgi:hypothetical protein